MAERELCDSALAPAQTALALRFWPQFQLVEVSAFGSSSRQNSACSQLLVIALACVAFAYFWGRSVARRNLPHGRGAGQMAWAIRTLVAAAAIQWVRTSAEQRVNLRSEIGGREEPVLIEISGQNR